MSFVWGRRVPMGVWQKAIKQIAWSGALLAAVFATASSAVAQQTATPEASAGITQPAELPDSPGATLARLQTPAQPQSAFEPSSGAPVQTEPQGQQSESPQSPQLQSQQVQPSPQNPVGTAAAEPTHAAGIAASQPAGVAIAPAKQRRVRTIVIRTAAIIGAGIAVGTVVALTEATGSKPPGAH
jgi:FtsZ-interacting cell division protein ZipA